MDIAASLLIVQIPVALLCELILNILESCTMSQPSPIPRSSVSEHVLLSTYQAAPAPVDL
jgi:hypothetical protein